MREIRGKLAQTLREELGQHLPGTLLTAAALYARLTSRQAPEAKDAAYLLDMLKEANKELNRLVINLNTANCAGTRRAVTPRNHSHGV